jgi:hypothetical protein
MAEWGRNFRSSGRELNPGPRQYEAVGPTTVHSRQLEAQGQHPSQLDTLHTLTPLPPKQSCYDYYPIYV